MFARWNHEFAGYLVRIMLALLIIIIFAVPLLHYLTR